MEYLVKKGHDEDTALPTNKSELYDVLHRLDKRLLPTTKTGDLRKNPSTRDMLECANEYALDGGRAASPELRPEDLDNSYDLVSQAV